MTANTLKLQIITVFLLGLIVPYNSKPLQVANASQTSASASPFVVAIQVAGIKALPGILNACILLFVFSAANSDLYVGTRTIYGLAAEGYAPRFLARTNNAGVPIYCILTCSLFACIGFLNISNSSATVFSYFTNLVVVFGMLAWLSLLIIHVFFVKARKAQGVADTELRFKSPFGIWGSYFGIFVVTILVLVKNFTVFVHSDVTGGDYGDFDDVDFITGYLGIPVFLVMFVGYKVVKKTSFQRPSTVDLYSGKEVFDEEEKEFIEQRRLEKETGQHRKGHWYKFIGWLF